MNYAIIDLDTKQTLIDENITYADRSDELSAREQSIQKFMCEHCLDNVTAFRIFCAKFLPDHDLHTLTNDFLNEAKNTDGDDRCANCVETGPATFEVRAFGQIIRCEVAKDS